MFRVKEIPKDVRDRQSKNDQQDRINKKFQNFHSDNFLCDNQTLTLINGRLFVENINDQLLLSA